MELRRMIFEQKQPMVVVCKSGRAMIALNEQVVKTMENMPTGMTDEGEMRYEEREKEQYSYDVCWIDGVSSEADVLQRAKEAVLAAIEAYDTSSSVNGFILNGERGWLDKATRVGLMNGVAVAKECGIERMSLWIDGREYVMDVERLDELLVNVEVYAMGCYNVTAGHRRAVDGLTTLEAVLGYDFKAGYPKMVSVVV